MTYPNHLPAERVGPGTAERPLVTEEGRVIVRGVCIAKLVQLPHNKRWVLARRDGGAPSAESWQYLEMGVDAVRAMYANGVPE